MNIYGIGGLGADERVFQSLDLKYQLIPISWIRPQKSESISKYSSRLVEQIDSKKPFVLIGVSFGGLVAVEISKIITPAQVILISSVETATEIPKIYRLLGQLGIVKIIPKKLLKPPFWMINYFFEAKNRKLLKEIIEDTDPFFLKWALQCLCTWTNERKISNLLNITSSTDRLLPSKDSGFIIKNGGHFMIVDRAKEISQIINNTITKFESC